MLIEVIAIVSPILNALQLYFYLKRTKQDDSCSNENKKILRVKNVVDNYIKLAEQKKGNGFSALFKSGIKEIQDNEEIEEVIKQIKDRGYKSPLGREEEKLRRFGLHKFFNIATSKLIEEKSIDAIISENNNGE